MDFAVTVFAGIGFCFVGFCVVVATVCLFSDSSNEPARLAVPEAEYDALKATLAATQDECGKLGDALAIVGPQRVAQLVRIRQLEDQLKLEREESQITRGKLAEITAVVCGHKGTVAA